MSSSLTSIKHVPAVGIYLSLSCFLPMLSPAAHALLCAAAFQGPRLLAAPHATGAGCSALNNCSLVFDPNPCRQRHHTCGMQPKPR